MNADYATTSLWTAPRNQGLVRRTPAGFALVVTVSIMVLLAVVAIGLLSLSSVVVRGANQSGAQEVAQANARLALVLAIGDLQKALGPDRRSSATADLAGRVDGTALEVGAQPRNNEGLDGVSKGLSTVLAGTRHWTGAFLNNDRPEEIYKKTPTATLDRWLVSGQGASPSGAPAVTPALASCAVDSEGRVADPSVAAVLVGENTVGTGAEAQSNYVAAPVVPVEVEGGLQGAYAYWVGDEGVKGRINMERSSDDDDSYASLVAQRRGWETVDGFDRYPEATGDADRALPGLVTLATTEVLLPEINDGGPSASQSSFHAASADSRGLLVNSLEGGLRVDLTAALRAGLPAEVPEGGYNNFPVRDGRVIPQLPTRQENLSELTNLTWNHLEDFYRRHEDLDGGALQVRPRTGPDSPSIAPVVLDFRILMGVRFDKQRTGRGEPDRYKVYPCGKLSVALANPYSVPMEWDRPLDFEIKNLTPSGNRPSRIWQLNSTCVYIPRDGSMENPGSEKAVFNQAVFRVGPGRLEPGEARAYTQGAKVVRPYLAASSPVVIDMAPFATAAPFDFDRCVEMTTDTEVTLPRTLDVRESWQTTLVALEMRLGSSRGTGGPWLRRLERFELDNGYFGPNQRRFDDTNTSNLRYPVPLMLYSFQISQPGMDYKNLMPALYEMGQRSSTVRTFADFNLRADTVHKAITSYNPPPYFMESNDSAALLPFRAPGGETGTGFTRNLVLSPLFWGRAGERGSNATVLFDVPREFVSLAQLQHADLTNDAVTVSVSHQPGNAFGNSYATPFVQRALVVQERTDYEIIGSPNQSGATQFRRNYYDMSHLLNSSLWDRYFFSSIDDATGQPVNPALVPASGTELSDPTDPQQVAGSLMIDGAFNVNSTSKEAWKVLLASSKHLVHPADAGAAEAAFPRSLGQPSGHELPPTGENNDSFSGYRRLTDPELDDLAEELVRQVRKRGPFVSLSHFVNRALVDITEGPRSGPSSLELELSRSGALQTALDESGVNISYDGSRNGFGRIDPEQDRVTFVEKEGAPRADLDGGDRGGRPPDADPGVKDWAVTSRDNNFGAVASIVADRDNLKQSGSSGGGRGDRSREQGYRSTGIPGWVTQADVLQVIGPVIATRSDTFRIRTSGEARDATGRVLATAWCEAIVQRQPAYLDPANAPGDPADVLTPVNATFGRRFEIVSFRWLSPNEI